MNAMFAYMSEAEKDWEIIESVINGKLTKLNLEFDKIMMKHQDNLAAIEEKVMLENGTEEDLEVLYTLEAKEAKKESKGILSSIIDAIVAFFGKIRKVLFGDPIDKGKLPDQVELPEDPEKLMKEGRETKKGIMGFISGHKGAIAGVLAAVAATGGIILTKTKIEPEFKKAEEFMKENEEELKELNLKLQNTDATPEEQNLLKKGINKLKDIGTRVSNCVKVMRSNQYKNHKDSEEKKTADEEYGKATQTINDLTRQRDHDLNERKKLQQQLDKVNNPGIFKKIAAVFTRDDIPHLKKQYDAAKKKSDKNPENVALRDEVRDAKLKLSQAEGDETAYKRTLRDEIDRLTSSINSASTSIENAKKTADKATEKSAKATQRMASRGAGKPAGDSTITTGTPKG